MKVRHGFVSNSSTSSFLIYGTCIDASDLQSMFPDDEEPFEHIEELLKGTGLIYHYGPYDADTCYVGRSWDSVKDDETGKQFKASVKAAVDKVFKKEMTCETHEETWHD